MEAKLIKLIDRLLKKIERVLEWEKSDEKNHKFEAEQRTETNRLLKEILTELKKR